MAPKYLVSNKVLQPFSHSLIDKAPKGPVFVWLHGWGQDKRSLMRLAGLFEKQATHYIFDLPGFGQTNKLADGAGTKDYADALAETLIHLKISTPIIFIGHSFGGRVAVQMAAHYPTMTKAIVLLAGAGLKRSRSFSFIIRANYLKLLSKISKISDKLFKTTFYKTYSQKYGSADYKAAGDLRPTFVRVVNEDLSEEAKTIHCETLLIYADQDTAAPPEIGKKYATLIPTAYYHELTGYGHLDMLDRGAYQCKALMDDFFVKLNADD